jgi:hypothetical protein
MAQPRLREDNSYETSLCAGHLLVWTWRKMVAGEESCPLITHEYEAVAGERAYAVLDDLAAFLLLRGRAAAASFPSVRRSAPILPATKARSCA